MGDHVGRKHGDAFPLPSFAMRAEAVRRGVSEAQRAYWISDSLNKLALSPSNSTPSFLNSNLPLTAVQECVADRICGSLSRYGECPVQLDPETAFLSLKGGKPCYDGVPNNLASYDADKLKILSKGTCPKHIASFLPPAAAVLVKNYDREILSPSRQHPSSFQPYWDPALRYNAGARLDFIHRLFRAGLMVLRPKAASMVGAFFVKKKSPDQIRMVIDCRGTNEMCRDPPVTRLASSRCYADLRLDNNDSGEPAAWGCEADVADCFYRFSMPEMSHMFAINHPLTAESWKKVGVYSDFVFDPDESREVKTQANQLLYPCFGVVPMGWNWALFLCNEAVVNIAAMGSPWSDGFLREKKVVPSLSEHRTLVGVYVDNITIIGRDREDVAVRCKALQSAFDQVGVPITWSQQQPVTVLESVGCLLDFESGILMNKPSRVWKFARATSAMLKRKKLTGDVLQVWAGHYTALCGITPWGLSVLEHTYRFICKAGGKRKFVWSSVRNEMKMAASLSWLTWKPLNAGIMRNVETGDASSSGYALMVTQPPPAMIEKAMRTHERWRFIPMPVELKDMASAGDTDGFNNVLQSLVGGPFRSHHVKGSEFQMPAGLSTSYAATVVEAMQEGSYLATSAVKSQVRARAKDRVDIDIPALVEPLDPYFANVANYRLLWSRRWRHVNEHISLKEGRVCLSSLRRSARVVAQHGLRKLTISDNLPIVSAFGKGRSSNHKVNRLCQQVAALLFSSGIQWSIRHIETKRNPSDEPSRRFERPNRRVHHETFGVAEPLGRGFTNEASAPSKPFQPFRQLSEGIFLNPGGRVFLEIFFGNWQTFPTC